MTGECVDRADAYGQGYSAGEAKGFWAVIARAKETAQGGPGGCGCEPCPVMRHIRRLFSLTSQDSFEAGWVDSVTAGVPGPERIPPGGVYGVMVRSTFFPSYIICLYNVSPPPP